MGSKKMKLKEYTTVTKSTKLAREEKEKSRAHVGINLYRTQLDFIVSFSDRDIVLSFNY